MKEVVSRTVYFAEPGPSNTDRTLQLVHERAKALDIHTVLVATTTGATAARAAELLPGLGLVVVTHSAGFLEPHAVEHDCELIAALQRQGICVLTTTHAFGGVGRAVRKKLGTYQVEEIVAYTLRCFSQGVKVAAEITLMASDAGLVQDAKPLIAVAGSGRGADTAVVLLPTHAQTFFDLQYLELICMPAPNHPNLK